MDVSKHFDREYLDLLKDIQANWQNNLNRNITNDIRREASSTSPHQRKLQDVSVTKDSTNIQLKNIKLTTPVTLVAGDIQVDFLNECLECNFKVHDLLLAAELCAFKCELLEMAVLQEGKVDFRLANIALTGRIGLLHNQDSLMPVNYDISVSPHEIETTITFISTGTPPENKTSVATKVEDTMVNMFWLELKEFIMRHFNRIIASNVVEYSFGEMFLDEPEKYKIFEKERTSMANALFDEQMKKFIALGPAVDLPVMNGCFKKNENMHHLQVLTCDFKDLTTMRRTTDASWFEDEEVSTVYAEMQITDFEFEFGECVITAQNEERNQVKGGGMKMLPDRNRIHVRFETPRRGAQRACRMHLDVSELELSGMQLADEQANSLFGMCGEHIQPHAAGYVAQHTESILQKYAQMFNTAAGN